MWALSSARMDARKVTSWEHVQGYFFPFFFFFFLSDAEGVAPAGGGGAEPFCDTDAPVGSAAVPVTVTDAAPADVAPGAVCTCCSGVASTKGWLEPAIANIMALLKISSRPRMAEERVRYLIVVVSSVTLSVRLCADARDLSR